MAFGVKCGETGVVVSLSGWDRWATLRRRVDIEYADIGDVSVESRDTLESLIDSRVRGIGTNIGTMRPGRMRVGIMMGRGVLGQQFWAVSSSALDQPLVVIDTQHDAPFARLVVEVNAPREFAHTVRGRLSPG